MRNAAFTVIVLAVVSILDSSATAQNVCTAYFTTYVYLSIPGISPRPGMTRKQEKWFHKKGKKQYPTLCEDAEKATYILVTSNHLNEVEQAVTVDRHAYTTGPVTEQVGVTASGPSLPPSQPIWATRMETFVTTWQEKEMRTSYSLHTEVFLLQTKKPLKEAVSQDDYYQPLRAAYADGPDADRQALEHAFWFLRIVAEAKK